MTGDAQVGVEHEAIEKRLWFVQVFGDRDRLTTAAGT
jgi:hypothetical protein